MAATESDVPVATNRIPEYEAPDKRDQRPTEDEREGGHRREGRGAIATWVGADPIRAVAVLLIIVGVAWRADIASRGYLAADDFYLTTQVAESRFSFDLLFNLYINHLMPGVIAITWLFTRVFGLVYWPYLVLLTVGQALIGITFYRLLRLLFAPRWGLLIPLCVVLFSPLTLENTSWWWSGANQLPMQLATILAIGAQTRYIRTRRLRHLGTLALSVLLGLLFFEKSLLIVPLVFAATACLFVTGGPIRGVTRAIRRYWPSWLVLTVLSAAYFAFYTSRAQSMLRAPGSVGEVLTFVRQIVGTTLIPGLVGGPWQWLNIGVGDGAPLAATTYLASWLACAAFLALVVGTVAVRPVASRAWVLLAVYVTLVACLLAATRLGGAFSGAAGLVPRYVSDVVVVGALCVGAALFAIRDVPGLPASPWTRPALLKEPGVVGAGLVVALAAVMFLAVGTASSAAAFADDWAIKDGREYVRTAQAELAKAPPGTVFFDRTVPDVVLGPLAWPHNLQSRFFRTVDPQPVFVDEAENPSVIDDTGRIRPLRIEGAATLPGPDGECGYKIGDGQTVRMPFPNRVFEWYWVVRVGYLSSADSTAVLRLGRAEHRFQLHRGLHQIYFKIEGGGDAVELRVDDPTVTICSDRVMVGNAHAQL